MCLGPGLLPYLDNMLSAYIAAVMILCNAAGVKVISVPCTFTLVDCDVFELVGKAKVSSGL